MKGISSIKFICLDLEDVKRACQLGIIPTVDLKVPPVMFEVLVVKNNQKIVYWSNFSSSRRNVCSLQDWGWPTEQIIHNC